MQNQTIEKLTARLKQIMLDTHEESFLKMAKEVLEGACCDKEKQYRLLRAGEVTQAGDEVLLGDKWMGLDKGNLHQPIKAGINGPYPEGYYRRLVESEADLWKAEAEKWREIAQKEAPSQNDFAQAIRWLAEGKKVRVSSWKEDSWIKLAGGHLVDSCGMGHGVLDIRNIFQGGWELYQEPAEQTTEPEPPQGINIGYRLLIAGEKLQEGDEVYALNRGEWFEAVGAEGMEINPPNSVLLPAGFYRRKI